MSVYELYRLFTGEFVDEFPTLESAMRAGAASRTESKRR